MIIDLLRRITNSLEERGINYMLSGSLALSVYTIPRMTLDIDIVLELKERSLDSFFQIFNEDYYISRETVKNEIKRNGMFNVIDFQSGFKIDFIIKKENEYRIHEFSRRRKELFNDFNVWIVSPEDLIISKLDWIQQLKSDKQIVDIQNLLAAPGIDLSYVNYWCKKLKLNTYELI